MGTPAFFRPFFRASQSFRADFGAGTTIRFTLTVGGRAQVTEARVDEPEPGRVLTETYVHNGAVTRFTVTPAGSQSRLQIETSWESRSGITGLIERLVAPRLLRRLYNDELDLIEQWAIDRVSDPEGAS